MGALKQLLLLLYLVLLWDQFGEGRGVLCCRWPRSPEQRNVVPFVIQRCSWLQVPAVWDCSEWWKSYRSHAVQLASWWNQEEVGVMEGHQKTHISTKVASAVTSEAAGLFYSGLKEAKEAVRGTILAGMWLFQNGFICTHVWSCLKRQGALWPKWRKVIQDSAQPDDVSRYSRETQTHSCFQSITSQSVRPAHEAKWIHGSPQWNQQMLSKQCRF